MAKFDVIFEALAWFSAIVVVAGAIIYHDLDLHFAEVAAFSNSGTSVASDAGPVGQ